ncbi:MAG TPA: DUF2474 domain-containing protein, partial [Rhodopila sp.]
VSDLGFRDRGFDAGAERTERRVDREGGPMWGRRILWMIAIWSASVLALGAAALAMRGLMSLAGLTG